jgi:hypothetical protein
VIRVVHGEGRSAQEWFRRGVRKASAAGAFLLRDPVKRRIGAREWHEARFRCATRDRTATVTTVQSATSYGPCVLEAYLRGPTRTIVRLLPEFDRVRQRLRGGALEAIPLTPISGNDLEGLWWLYAGTAISGRESYRFTSDGSLEHRDADRTTQLSYALSDAGILTTSALGSLKRDLHSCFRVTRALREPKLESGDLVIVRHTPAGRPVDVRVLRDAD